MQASRQVNKKYVLFKHWYLQLTKIMGKRKAKSSPALIPYKN